MILHGVWGWCMLELQGFRARCSSRTLQQKGFFKQSYLDPSKKKVKIMAQNPINGHDSTYFGGVLVWLLYSF